MYSWRSTSSPAFCTHLWFLYHCITKSITASWPAKDPVSDVFLSTVRIKEPFEQPPMVPNSCLFEVTCLKQCTMHTAKKCSSGVQSLSNRLEHPSEERVSNTAPSNPNSDERDIVNSHLLLMIAYSCHYVVKILLLHLAPKEIHPKTLKK